MDRAFILRLKPSTVPNEYGTKSGFFRCLAYGCDWNVPGGLERGEATAYKHNKVHHKNELQVVLDMKDANKRLAEYLAKVRMVVSSVVPMLFPLLSVGGSSPRPSTPPSLLMWSVSSTSSFG